MKIPKRSEMKKSKILRLCGQLYKNYKDFIWILDDESHFSLSLNDINDNDIFYSSDVSLTPSDIKFKEKKKFEEKLLVYIIFSPVGLSTPFIVLSETAINQHVYVK